MRRASKKKAKIAKPVRRTRGVHAAQRQRLIEACISALHIYGPSRTTVEKVVAIANMSPGIVRFYFASKAAMLVAALQFLSSEFEEQLLIPVSGLKATPVAALELMVALYLDPEIASPRKVSVWYAFWGEASSRQEYYDICGQKDEGFAALVRELIEAMISEVAVPHLDADGIALGLIGVLEVLWQDFAFKTEAEIDRDAAVRRCHAFLGSVFPGKFSAPVQVTARPSLRYAAQSALPATPRPARWIYEDRTLFSLERERIFNASWQFVGHQAQLAAAGSFIAVDLGNERVFIVRDEQGVLRSFRNSCSETPHALITEPKGELHTVACAIHGVSFGLDGKRRGSRGSADLSEFELRGIGDLLLARAASEMDGSIRCLQDDWPSVAIAADSRSVSVHERRVTADWKLVVEGWLDDTARREVPRWSSRQYQRVVGDAKLDQHGPAVQRLLAPNHWLDLMPDGYSITQVLPTAPGRCVCRESAFTWCADNRTARVARYLAGRTSKKARVSLLNVAASTQEGMFTFGNHVANAPLVTPQVAAFRQRLGEVIPALNADSAEVLRGVA